MEIILPRWQNHRGYREAGAQENTMEAMITSNKQGYEMVELDVQLSGDRIPVVCHDYDLKRVAGDSRRVDSLTAMELSKLANIPTLEEILLSMETPLWLNIEMKCNTFSSGPLESKVIQLVKNCSKRVIFSSFNPFVLHRAYKKAPDIPRALIVTLDENDPGGKIYLRKMWFRSLSHPTFVNMNYKYIDQNLIDQMADKGISVAAWTVNNDEDAQRLFKMGVASVITDNLRPV